jgi:hypothetical protein
VKLVALDDLQRPGAALGNGDRRFCALVAGIGEDALDEREKAARAQAGTRYDNFVAALGRRLSQGPKLRQEIPEDVQQGET